VFPLLEGFFCIMEKRKSSFELEDYDSIPFNFVVHFFKTPNCFRRDLSGAFASPQLLIGLYTHTTNKALFLSYYSLVKNSIVLVLEVHTSSNKLFRSMYLDDTNFVVLFQDVHKFSNYIARLSFCYFESLLYV